MLKYWIFCMAIITLFAATVPCCGLKGHCSDANIQHTDTDYHKNANKACSNCSPFFACGTCSGCILPSQTGENLLKIPPMPERTKITFSRNITSFRILKPLWKPPRF